MPEKNHYLPIFYQRRWRGPDENVCAYSRPYKEARARRLHPSAIGYQLDLYTVPGGDPRTARHLERRFFQVTDDRAARALAVIEQQRLVQLDFRLRSDWTRFVMSLLHRTPEEMQTFFNLVSLAAAELRATFESSYEAIKTDSDPLDFEQFWKERAIDFIGRMWITGTQGTIDSRKLGEYINNLYWRVFEINGSYTLMTGDRPILMSNGLSGPDGHIALPIGPRKLFVAARAMQTMKMFEAWRHDDLAKTVNNRVVRQARRFCIATNDSNLTFFSRRFGEQIPSSPLDGMLDTKEGSAAFLRQFTAAVVPELSKLLAKETS